MIRIFSVLASLNALALLTAFSFGLTSMVRGSFENKDDTIFTVQPVATAWPGDASHLFLRLKISPKHWLPFLAQLIFAVNTSFYKN